MNTRIKDIRKEKNLTQEAFSEKIGIKRNSLAQIESGARTPSTQVILAICREYDVDEIWLRTGEGEPHRQVSREDEIANFFGKILKGDHSFKTRFIAALARTSEEEWAMIEKFARRLLDEDKNNDPE